MMSKTLSYSIDLNWRKYISIPPAIHKRIVDEINSFKPHVPVEMTYCDFSFTVVLDDEGDEFIKVEGELDISEWFDEKEDKSNLHFYDDAVISRIKDVLFTLNLAYPGYVFIDTSELYRDGSPVEMLSYSNDISGLTHNDCAWLVYEDLTIQQCWDWITSRTNFLSLISKTSIDRVLHALSYESVASEDTFIFYVLMGIEAIYNDGSNREDSIMQQLCRKAQAVLGDLPDKAVKALKEMYKKRSMLVHGCANIFKCWESEIYDEDEYDRIEQDRGYMVTATGILIATIQKFIKADATSLVEHVTVELK